MRLPSPLLPDEAAAAAARARLDPRLGRLREVAAWWCGVRRRCPPDVPDNARLLAFGADPGASLALVAEHHGVEVRVVGVEEGEMTRAEAEAAVEAGIACAIAASREGVALLGAGCVAAEGSTSAAAVLSAVAAMPGKLTTGTAEAARIVDAALARHAPDRADGIGILSAVGGRELATIAGLCIGGAAQGVPVVLDGFGPTAAGLVASVLSPGCVPFFVVAHRSSENAHWAMSRYLRKEPLHDLDMRVEDGTGAALGIDLVRLAAKLVQLGRGGASSRG